MDILVFTANGLYLVSYFTKEMLHLRILTVIAATCLSAYFYFQPEPMMTVVGWHLFFIALNLFQIARIVIDEGRLKNRRWAFTRGKDAVVLG